MVVIEEEEEVGIVEEVIEEVGVEVEGEVEEVEVHPEEDQKSSSNLTDYLESILPEVLKTPWLLKIWCPVKVSITRKE